MLFRVENLKQLQIYQRKWYYLEKQIVIYTSMTNKPSECDFYLLNRFIDRKITHRQIGKNYAR